MMSRKVFLTIASIIAMSIGAFVLFAPEVLLVQVKMAPPNASANVMARTVGILIFTFGVLAFLVRGDEDSPTLRSVLFANLILQLGILPIDPHAYATGAYQTLGSFVPNTILHVLLASGFAYYLVKMKPSPAPRRHS
jgi:hypothetical protein